MPGFDTESGGTIDMQLNKDAFTGFGLLLTVDQSSNIKNTDDAASIILSNGEVKAMINLFHDFLKFTEGKDYLKLVEDIEKEKELANTPPEGDKIN